MECSVNRGMRVSVCIRSLLVATVAAATSLVSEGEVVYRPSVIGGKPAAQGEYPWMVALLSPGDTPAGERQFCSGFLVDKEWVLTAAHCVDDHSLEKIQVAIGKADINDAPQISQVSMILIHPANYGRSGRGVDLALLQLERPIEGIVPLSLNRSAAFLRSHDTGRIIGWGRTQLENDPDESVLQFGDVDISFPPDTDWRISLIATGREDPFANAGSGDSGGPLLIRSPEGDWIATGIASLGNDTNTFYTDTTPHVDWIDSVIMDEPWSNPSTSSEPITRLDLTTLEFKIWPFSDSEHETFSISNNLRTWTPTTYSITDDYDQQWNPDGSVSLPLGDQYGHRKIFIGSKPNNSRSGRTGLFPLHPEQPTIGKVDTLPSSFNQRQRVYRLNNLIPEREYTLSGDFSNIPVRLCLFQLNSGSLELIRKSGGNSLSFIAKENAEYWTSIEATSPSQSLDYAFQLTDAATQQIDHFGWVDSELSNSDPTFRRNGFRFKRLQSSLYYPGDVKIEIDSTFDAEAIITDKRTGKEIAYFDENSENEVEVFYVDNSTLESGTLSVFNFDKNVFGSFRVRLTNHVESQNLPVGADERRAITRSDLRSELDGDVTYFERIKIESTYGYESVTVEVSTFYGASLLFAIWDVSKDEFIDTKYREDLSITFSPLPETEYYIILAAVDGSINLNYDLKIKGDFNVPSDPNDPNDPDSNFHDVNPPGDDKTRFSNRENTVR